MSAPEPHLQVDVDGRIAPVRSRGANPWVAEEQAAVERFVRGEYWRLARLRDGRFAHTRAPLVRRDAGPQRQSAAAS